MPWIDKDTCTSCGACIEECPVETIFMNDDEAEINMDNCIRCGQCHQICPEGAVRHDSEKAPERIEVNVREAKRMMAECEKYLDGAEEGKKCLKRLLKYYKNEKNIAEKTITELESL